jgi:signal transduction histidine kinase
VSVKDNGSGIPEEMHNKIFVPNFTTKSSGTGLGLAICKGIVEKSNGAIWFETEEGKGTTFFVSLPIVQA